MARYLINIKGEADPYQFLHDSLINLIAALKKEKSTLTSLSIIGLADTYYIDSMDRNTFTLLQKCQLLIVKIAPFVEAALIIKDHNIVGSSQYPMRMLTNYFTLQGNLGKNFQLVLYCDELSDSYARSINFLPLFIKLVVNNAPAFSANALRNLQPLIAAGSLEVKAQSTEHLHPCPRYSPAFCGLFAGSKRGGDSDYDSPSLMDYRK